MFVGVCGSLESSDCLISVKRANNTTIKLESTVIDLYGEHIRKIITDTLKEIKIGNVEVVCTDRGALDYTIIARLLTAIERMKKNA